MKFASKTQFTAAVAILAAGIGILTPSSAVAQRPSTFKATLYGFVPNLSGETAFPTPLGTTFDVNNETLIENTDFAMMGLFEVQKGRIGGFTDVMSFNIGANKSLTRDVTLPGAPIVLPVTADTNLDIKAWVAEAAMNIRAFSGSAGTLDVFGGTRRLEAKGALGYAFSSPFGPGPRVWPNRPTPTGTPSAAFAAASTSAASQSLTTPTPVRVIPI